MEPEVTINLQFQKLDSRKDMCFCVFFFIIIIIIIIHHHLPSGAGSGTQSPHSSIHVISELRRVIELIIIMSDISDFGGDLVV